MSLLLTQRQLARLERLPEDHTVVSARDGAPIVRRPDGQFLRLQPNGRLAPTTLIRPTQRYTEVAGD